jgi:1,4-alpha-glucan branching enzyme
MVIRIVITTRIEKINKVLNKERQSMNKNKSPAANHHSLQSSIDKKLITHFEFLGKAGSQVFVAGTFNNWCRIANPLKDNPDSGHFQTDLRLTNGMHEYKFVVDGKWIEDPKSEEYVQNIYGSLNSVLFV